MAVASIIGNVAGGTFGAAGALGEGRQKSYVLEYQAKIQENNAREARMAAKANADRLSMLATHHLGAISAGYGASGVSSDSGSVLAVIGASAANAELDRQNILHGGEIRAINYENQAMLDETGAKHAIDASYYSAAASLFGAGTKLATSLSGKGGGDDGKEAGADWSSPMDSVGDESSLTDYKNGYNWYGPSDNAFFGKGPRSSYRSDAL